MPLAVRAGCASGLIRRRPERPHDTVHVFPQCERLGIIKEARLLIADSTHR